MNPKPALLVLLILSLCTPRLAEAGEVQVRIPGPLKGGGEIGCGLFSGAEGFPMASDQARMIWQPAQADGVVCSFRDVDPGLHAISVHHDSNGNRRVDTQLFGIPREAWGVSNNVRPSFRAPRFHEAAFRVTEGEVLELVIEVRR